MKFDIVHFGAENASALPDSSSRNPIVDKPVRTTGDLLRILGQNPTRSFKMLRTVCGWLGRYLELPGDEIPFDLIEDRKRGFRPFLESRRLRENSVRSYVYQQRALLKCAMRHGWSPDGHATEPWKPLLRLAVKKHLTDITRYFSRATQSPAEVTKDAVDQWGEARVREGLIFTTVATKKNHFWQLLEETGWIAAPPVHLLRFRPYGIPLREMPTKLREDILAVLKWKQAEIARNRPKYGRIRAITARNVRLTLQQLVSYVVNVCGANPQSMPELIQQDYVEGFLEWIINERHVRPSSIEGKLAGVLAIVKYHPMFKEQDFGWFKRLLDALPVEDPSERKKRKASRYVAYDELEAIPARIRAFRETCERKLRKDPVKIARLAMEELMFRWYLVFPWRQRNLRECRISGMSPNLFKAQIPPITEIDKPLWIQEEEARNPGAEFWQISFNPDGTKTHISVDLFVPRCLVGPLEEYLAVYRPTLVKGGDPGTLFVTARGKPMRPDQVEKVIGHWTTVCAGRRTTPHILRDSVAYKWLKEHPKDYLTLSKILWHKNVQTTIQIYGSKFNESSGVCAMEAWLDERIGKK
jgi:site-specific recombinase XerD